jgi:hypothetical protein
MVDLQGVTKHFIEPAQFFVVAPPEYPGKGSVAGAPGNTAQKAPTKTPCGSTKGG